MFTDAGSGYSVTRSAFRDLALSLAHGITHFKPAGSGLLKRGLPLRTGQVALVFSPNSLGFLLVFYGLQAAGVTTTLANASYNPRELAHQLRDSNADIAFVHSSLLSVLDAAWKELGVDAEFARRRTIIMDWEPWTGVATATSAAATRTTVNQLLTLGKLDHEVKFTGKRVHQTALMCYSSGTTGLAKGVETSHYNLVSLITMGKCTIPSPGPRPHVALCVLPMYHIFSIALNGVSFPTYGIPVVIHSGPFSPDAFCANIAKYQITTSFVVPPILLAMAKHPAPTKYDMTSLFSLVSGAAPLSDSLSNAVVARMKGLGANISVVQGYGLTETSPTVFFLTEPESITKMGSVGRMIPNIHIRLVVDGPGEVDAKDGEPGEIWVRGPSIMKGYLNNPKANAEVLTKDGFFKTGDIAIRDSDGFYRIVDRKKELIKYKGFQVPPAELEAVLITHPEIADAAVIGVYSNEQETELPRAYVAHAKGLAHFKTPAEKEAFEKQIVEWIASRVAKHKQLRGGVSVIDVVPKSAAGKILRRQLRDRVKAETGRDPVTGKPVKQAKL